MRLTSFIIPIALAGATLLLAAAPSLADDLVVTQAGRKFSTERLDVKAGQTVTFDNNDDVTHNIQVKQIGFSSGSQAPGVKAEIKFPDAGDYLVRCGIHPQMKMTVHVDQ